MKTKPTRTLLALVTVTVMILLPLTAYAQCDGACKLPPKAERGDCWIVIDANTGVVKEGSTRFPDRCEQIQVYYVNKNPFKYSYSFTSKFVPFDTDAALAFLKLAFTGDSLKALGPGPAAPAAAAACAGDDLTKKNSLLKAADDKSEEFRKAINDAATAYDTYQAHLKAFFDKTDDDNAFQSNTAGCTSLCQEAKTDLVEYSALKSPEDLDAKVKAFEDDLAALVDEANKYQPSHSGANNDDCKTEIREAVNQKVKQIKDDLLTKAKDKIAKLKTAKEALDQKTKIVKAGASDTFVEVVPAQRDDSRGGKLSLTIARKNLRTPDSKLDDRTVTLLIGEPNLFFTAGIGFSTVSDRRVIRQAGLVSDGKGGTKLGSVFGFEENSNFKPSGVFMLTAPIKKLTAGSTIGPSAGLVLSSRNGTTEPEFIAGLSVGLLRNTVFITGGFHAARREVLASGFKIGQEIPADLKDPLPLEKRFTGGAMFAITYRIK